VSLSGEQLARLAGLYRNPVDGTFGRVFVRDGQIMASAGAGDSNSVELIPVNASRFIVPGTPIEVDFVPAASGPANEIHVTGIGPAPLVSQRVAAFAPSSGELRAFAGQYASPDLDVTYQFATRGSDLVIQMPGRSAVVLQPIFPDAFHGDVVDVVKFVRDARGAVTGFTVETAGVRGLRFDRIGQ
jgi:hypothetical protein